MKMGKDPYDHQNDQYIYREGSEHKTGLVTNLVSVWNRSTPVHWDLPCTFILCICCLKRLFPMWYCLCSFKVCGSCSAIQFLNSVVTNISSSAFCTLKSLKSHCPRPFKLKSISSSFYDSDRMLRDLGHERLDIKMCWTWVFAADRFRVWPSLRCLCSRVLMQKAQEPQDLE